MNIRLAGIAGIAVVGALALASCSSNTTTAPATSGASATPTSAAYTIDPTLTGTLTAGGSSAQANAQAAWIAAFTATAKGVTVNYDKSLGSGGGVTNFNSGSFDFAGSDSPLTADQTTASKAVCTEGGINIPVYLDGVTIAYNLSGVTSLKLSASTIAKIFNEKITDWSDPAITTDNGTALPAGKIQVVARSDASGTTQNFTNYLAGTVATDWPYKAANKWPVSGGTASLQQGSTGVANQVKATAGSIGYIDHSAVGALNTAAVISAGTAVPFSAAAVAQTFSIAATDANNGVAGDLSKKFDYTKMTAATYPIPLLSYDIVCSTFKNPAQAKLTKAYLGFVTSDLGQQVSAKNAGSAPLPADILTAAAKSLAAVK